jgi:hypothetical protein
MTVIMKRRKARMAKTKFYQGMVRLDQQTYYELRKLAIDRGHGSFNRLAGEVLKEYLADTTSKKNNVEKRASE